MERNEKVLQKALLDLSFGIICLLLGLWTYINARTAIPTATYEVMGAEVIPQLVGLSIILLSLWLIISASSHFKKGFKPKISIQFIKMIPILCVLVLFILFILTIEKVGFRLASFVFLTSSIWILSGFKRKVLIQAIFIGGTATLAIYYGLKVALRLMLP